MSLKTSAYLKRNNVLEGIFKDVLFIALLCLVILNLFDYDSLLYERPHDPSERHYSLYNTTVNEYYQKRKFWVTSNLGSSLFKNKPINYGQKNNMFDVLIYRHLYYSDEKINKSLRDCPVKNCKFTSDERAISTADAVVIMLTSLYDVPWVHKRKPSQIWVLLTQESPVNEMKIHRDYHTLRKTLENAANFFNWTMTYRSDSDIPIPYGRVVPLTEIMVKKLDNEPITHHIPYWNWKQKEVLAAAMISDCLAKKRFDYIHELQKYMKVDLYGNCATNASMKTGCPEHDAPYVCLKLNKYLFHLSFENSFCRQYLTEKVFLNAFTKGAIPVVMGAPASDYEKLLPPHSFLHVNSFISPRDLALELINLSKNDLNLLAYHQWRRFFKISIEANNYPLCRLCQALIYNDNATKIYDIDLLRLYFDPKLVCEMRYEQLGTSPPLLPNVTMSPSTTKSNNMKSWKIRKVPVPAAIRDGSRRV